jgi:hypothetical protein
MDPYCRRSGHMLESSRAYSGFATDDLDKAREFYGQSLGFEVQSRSPAA